MRPILYLAILTILYSCSPNILFRTKKNYTYAVFNDSLVASKGYKIAINDFIDLKIFTNDGFKLIDVTNVQAGEAGIKKGGASEYVVEYDGYCKLPVLGQTMLAGYTIRQAELMLEEKFSAIYVKPFVQLHVNNKRIFIFPGPGSARVLSLGNNNTRLIEVIAMIGGIPGSGISRKIKIIRGNSLNPIIYKVDLRTIDGLKQAQMVMQADDIVYIENRRNIPAKITSTIAPYLSLISTITLVYALFGRVIK